MHCLAHFKTPLQTLNGFFFLTEKIRVASVHIINLRLCFLLDVRVSEWASKQRFVLFKALRYGFHYTFSIVSAILNGDSNLPSVWVNAI
jgi:hypothetical protein